MPGVVADEFGVGHVEIVTIDGFHGREVQLIARERQDFAGSATDERSRR